MSLVHRSFSDMTLALASCCLLAALSGCGTEVGNGSPFPHKEEETDKKDSTGAPGNDAVNESFDEVNTSFAAAALVLFNNCASPLAESLENTFNLEVSESTGAGELGKILEFSIDQTVHIAQADDNEFYSSYQVDAGGDGGIIISISASENLDYRNFTCGADSTTTDVAIDGLSGTYTRRRVALSDDNGERTLTWYLKDLGTKNQLTRVEVSAGDEVLVFSYQD